MIDDFPIQILVYDFLQRYYGDTCVLDFTWIQLQEALRKAERNTKLKQDKVSSHLLNTHVESFKFYPISCNFFLLQHLEKGKLGNAIAKIYVLSMPNFLTFYVFTL